LRIHHSDSILSSPEAGCGKDGRRYGSETNTASGPHPGEPNRRGGRDAPSFGARSAGQRLIPSSMARRFVTRVASAAGVGWLVLMLTVTAATAAEAQRVLVIHSFGSTAPPFTTHSRAFETALTQEMGKRVDLDEVSLDMARYAQPDMEAPFAEFLAKRLAKWRPHLVVPIGSPAGRFVAKFRHRLFPDTPIIYTGMDRRTLPPDAFQRNATFVGEDFDLAGLIEDILQIAPDTTNIEVILGATPLERYWAVHFRSAFERFTPRVTLNFLNDLSFDQMLERLSKLPPRSFILLGLLLRDAAGVTHNEDEALQRLHAVANAPINGLYQNQLGLGIVGGRLYQGELQGEESARVAVRILRGEPTSNFPPRIIGMQSPRYDWRELRRWNISEERLPPGSRIEFRQPTMWQRYRWWIVGIGIVGLLQAGLIVQLAVNLARRRRVETALRESDERVNLAADAAGAGLWGLDVASRRIWATPRLRELFGLAPAEELDDQRLLKVVHPADREQVGQSFRASVSERSPLTLEFRIVRNDGSERWIATRGRLNGSAGSEPGKRWSGVSVDVTERKLAEERLRESESRFRTVADSAPVLIWMAGVDMLFTFFNKAWLDFTGRPVEDELGYGWTGGIHPDDLPASLKTYVDAFAARRPFVLQYRLRRHDGEYRWMSDNGVPRFDGQGTFVGYIGSCSDITERLRAEDKFRQVFEAAPSAMIMANRDGTIVLVNAEAERVFGYGREELVGRPIETLIPQRFRHQHADDRTEFTGDPRRRAMATGRDVVGRRKDGSELPVEISLNPIRTVEGLFVVASVIDISERRRAAAETEGLRQELTHISRVAVMGELMAAMVHEIGQPLSAILTNAQAGLRLISAGTHDTNEIREILEDIADADRRAAQVMERLRSLFRKGEVERQPLVLNQVISDAVSVVLNDASRRRVSIGLELDPRLLVVAADRVQLQQVLLNLVVNAFDAMGAVSDRPRKVTIRTRVADGEHVQLDVADTGTGIPPERLDAIFQPFVSTKAGGMGMGLSVSHSIIDAHEGRLWAENNPDGGAVFRIILPAISDAQTT
jgi:two-component system, LuxR family, sensor kinase FixL